MIITHMPNKCDICSKPLGRKHRVTTDGERKTVCYTCFITVTVMEELRLATLAKEQKDSIT
jgi:ribosome-binding protein aMBF1 (putative translation factor)